MDAISLEEIEEGLIDNTQEQNKIRKTNYRQSDNDDYDSLLRRLAHIRRMVEIKKTRMASKTGHDLKLSREDLRDYQFRMSNQLIEEHPWLLKAVKTVEKKQN